VYERGDLPTPGPCWLPLDVDVDLRDGECGQGVVGVKEAKVRLGYVEVKSLEEGDDWQASL
jgi:hypothetical protein